MSHIFDKHILTKLFVNSYNMFIKNQIFSRGSDEYFTIFVANNFYCLFLIQKNSSSRHPGKVLVKLRII